MPEWDAEELRQAAEIAHSIECCSMPDPSPRSGADIHLRLSEVDGFKVDLASTPRAIVVRQLCRALNFDENHHFRWRLEHKLTQGLVLNYFLPEVVPVTRGLSRLARKYGAACLARGLTEEFPDGLYIKAALGDSSGEYPDTDKTSHYLAAIAENRQTYLPAESITDEEIVVQDRLQIHKEYRVHTLEGRVVDDLTFLRYGRGNIPGERDRPNAWIQSLLDRLPPALVSQSLLGWDVALDTHGVMRVIEVNFTGFHPVFRRGFQCSGYYQDPEWGASLTSRLLRFVEKEHGLTIHVDVDCDDSQDRAFHANVARWLDLFRAGHP